MYYAFLGRCTYPVFFTTLYVFVCLFSGPCSSLHPSGRNGEDGFFQQCGVTYQSDWGIQRTLPAEITTPTARTQTSDCYVTRYSKTHLPHPPPPPHPRSRVGNRHGHRKIKMGHTCKIIISYHLFIIYIKLYFLDLERATSDHLPSKHKTLSRW